MRAPRLLLILLPAVLLAAPASATTLYEDDFSDYVNEWWPDVDFVQNVDTVTFTGDGALGSTTAFDAIDIATFDTAMITLDVADASMDSDMRIAISYWTSGSVVTELGWGYIDDVTGAGSFGGLLSTASFQPPANTDVYRVRLELTNGTVEVDNVLVSVIPEPESGMLVGFGLLALTIARRRGALA